MSQKLSQLPRINSFHPTDLFSVSQDQGGNNFLNGSVATPFSALTSAIISGSTTTPGGNPGSVQYNNNGSFGGGTLWSDGSNLAINSQNTIQLNGQADPTWSISKQPSTGGVVVGPYSITNIIPPYRTGGFVVKGSGYGSNAFEVSSNGNTFIRGYVKDYRNAYSLNTNYRTLYDTSSNRAINWGSRSTYDNYNTHSINWQNRNAYDQSSAISINWQYRGLYDSNQYGSVNWQTRTSYDSYSTPSINWEARNLIDMSGNTSAHFSDRTLVGQDRVVTLDWEQKLLESPAGNLNWVNGPNPTGTNDIISFQALLSMAISQNGAAIVTGGTPTNITNNVAWVLVLIGPEYYYIPVYQ